jgi:hypothetical protein
MFEAMHEGKKMRDLEPIWYFLLCNYLVEPCFATSVLRFCCITFLVNGSIVMIQSTGHPDVRTSNPWMYICEDK